MRAALRTETRKIATTGAWWLDALVMAGYMLVVAVIMAVAFVLAARAGQGGAALNPGGPSGSFALDPRDTALSVYTLAVALGYIFPAVLGVLVVTSEFRHRTIATTLLAEPDRTIVLGAKLAAVVPFALVVGLAGVSATLVGGAATLAAMGEPTFLADSGVQRALLLSVVALTLWSLVGVGVGTVMTNQIAAIVVLLVFTQFVEPLLRVFLAQFEVTEGIAKFLPGAAGEAVVGSSLYSSSGLAQLLAPWQGAVVLALYALMFLLIGRMTTFRGAID